MSKKPTKPTEEEIQSVQAFLKEQNNQKQQKLEAEDKRIKEKEGRKLKNLEGKTIKEVVLNTIKPYSIIEVSSLRITLDDGTDIEYKIGQYGSDNVLRIKRGKDYLFYE